MHQIIRFPDYDINTINRAITLNHHLRAINSTAHVIIVKGLPKTPCFNFFSSFEFFRPTHNFVKMNGKQWIARQTSDKFVKLKSAFNYRSRAAFKLYEIHQKFTILKIGSNVLDLGCAPGSWSQVASMHIGPKGKCFGVDLVAMEELENVEFIHGDIREPSVLDQLQKVCGQGRIIDTLISDMAHPFTGSKSTDVARVHDLVRFAVQVADMPQILKRNGNFVAKYLNGEGEDELRESLSTRFKKLHVFKPKSSRSSSTEAFFVGIGFIPPNSAQKP